MTADTGPETFSEAVKAFESASPWLGAPHMLALVTLRKLAAALDDGDMTPALVAQFGLTSRNLAKLAPAPTETRSPLAAALAEAQDAA